MASYTPQSLASVGVDENKKSNSAEAIRLWIQIGPLGTTGFGGAKRTLMRKNSPFEIVADKEAERPVSDLALSSQKSINGYDGAGGVA